MHLTAPLLRSGAAGDAHRYTVGELRAALPQRQTRILDDINLGIQAG